MRLLISLLLFALFGADASAEEVASPNEPIVLFDGKSLDAFTTWLKHPLEN